MFWGLKHDTRGINSKLGRKCSPLTQADEIVKTPNFLFHELNNVYFFFCKVKLLYFFFIYEVVRMYFVFLQFNFTCKLETFVL